MTPPSPLSTPQACLLAFAFGLWATLGLVEGMAWIFERIAQ